MRRALVPLVLAVAAALALPASAAATLVYTTQPSRKPPVLWSAFNDGSGAIRLGSNYSGREAVAGRDLGLPSPVVQGS